jgi:hypothetical protein
VALNLHVIMDIDLVSNDIAPRDDVNDDSLKFYRPIVPDFEMLYAICMQNLFPNISPRMLVVAVCVLGTIVALKAASIYYGFDFFTALTSS